MDYITRVVLLMCCLCFLMPPLWAMTQAEFIGLPLKQRRAVLLDIARQHAAGRDETVWALHDTDLVVRTLALEILGEHPDLRTAAQLAGLLTDPKSWIPAWRVRKALLTLGAPAVPPLVEQMKTVTRERGNLQTIAEVLVQLHDPSAVPPLFELVAEEGRRTRDPNNSTARCPDALIALNPDPVLAVLEHPEDPFWHHAARLLPERLTAGQQTRLIAALRNALKAPERGVRYNACAMLGRYDPAATGLLLEALKDPELRTAALRGLHGRKTPEVIAAILPLLQTRDTSTLFAALSALEGVRQPELVDALLPLLAMQSRVSDEALELLINQDDPRVLPAVLRSYDQMRNSSVKVMRYLGEQRAEAAIPALIPLLGEEEVYWFSTERAKAAVDALARMGAPAYQPLVRALHSPDREQRMMAARALGQLGDPAVIPELRKLWDDRYWQVYEDAARAIGRLGDPGVYYLLAALQDPDPRVRGLAACGLGASQASRVVDPLLRCLADPSEDVAAYASWALVHRNDPRVMEPLILRANYFTNALAENDEIGHAGVPHGQNMLEAFAKAYAHFGVAAVPVLQQAARRPDTDREIIACVLGRIGDDAAITVMIEMLADPPASLSFLFVELGAPAVPPLIRALHDPRPRARKEAAAALACMRRDYFSSKTEDERDSMYRESEKAFSELLTMVAKDPDPGCRMQAALALGGFQRPLLELAPLRAALDDPSPMVRMAAAVSAGQLGDVLAIDRLKILLADETELDWIALSEAYGEIIGADQPPTVNSAASQALYRIEGPQPDGDNQ